MFVIKNCGILLISILFLTCSTSKLVYSWVPEGSTQNKFNSIMVLALIKDNDRYTQEKMEAHLSLDLSQKGYQAFSALKVYGPNSFEIMTQKEAFEKLKGSDVDAILTIVLVNKNSEYVLRPSRNSAIGEVYEPMVLNYYSDIYRQMMDPNFYLLNTEYFWESSLYDLNKNKLVYTSQTQSFNPASTESLAHEYGKLIVKDILKKKVF